MNTLAVSAPRRLGSRRQARMLLESYPADLRGVVVLVDFSRTEVAAPSFLDEIVKAILEERHAAQLVVRTDSQRLLDLARRSARRRGFADRIRRGA